MDIDILLFATIKDIVGSNKLTLTIAEESTLKDVKEALARQYPEASTNIHASLASINREYAFDTDAVTPGDEVAFFPPVSGGDGQKSRHSQVFQLAEDPINHDEMIQQITTPETGAVCLFSGFVRGKTDKAGHLPQTERLEYEAYEPMALAKMQQVADEIRNKWDKVQGIAIIQRIGVLEVGQNTILIACSSAHRDDGCFEAARYGIDRLKEIVPVWKREVSPTGQTWIEGEYTPTSADRAD